MNIVELITEFRDMSYETGWIAGKIEAGGKYNTDYQDKCIAKRNELETDLTNRIADMLEALNGALRFIKVISGFIGKESETERKVREAIAKAKGRAK